MGGTVFGDVVFLGDDGDFLFTVFSSSSDFDFSDAVELGGESLGDMLFAVNADDASDGAFISDGVARMKGGAEREEEGAEEKTEFHKWRQFEGI